MKRFHLFLLLLTILAGCTSVSTEQEKTEIAVFGLPTLFKCAEGLCIEVEVNEPIVFGEPITVRITVTSEEDIADLRVYLTSIPYNHITIEDPVKEEEGIVIEQLKQGILWKVDAKADQPVTFVRNLTTDFSIDENCYLQLQVEVFTRRGLLVHNHLTILFSEGKVNVYYPGTPVPFPTIELRYKGTLPTIYITPGVTIYPTRQATMTPVPTTRRSTPTPTVNPYPIHSPQPPQPSPTELPYP